MMNEKNNKIDRREFLKTVGVSGLAPAVIGVSAGFASAADKPADEKTAGQTKEATVPQVPKRVLGKTGVKVSCLGLGMMYNVVDNQTILRSALKYGVTYWDTANNYGGGNSELGIGVFFEKNPAERKNVFLASRASGAKTVAEVEERLQTSLKRMKTDFIDMYGLHGIADPSALTEELKKWVEDAKKRKLIRYFDFSTHSNIPKLLMAASKLDWIDAVMASYNFRQAGNAEMQEALDAIYKAKIGFVAMKTIGQVTGGRGGQPAPSESDKKLTDKLTEKGFTLGQAALKLVQADERISCVNVGMSAVEMLTANVAAVLDKTALTQADKDALLEYAKDTCTGYCAGCSQICDSALAGRSYVNNIMRYLMYYNSYADKQMARALFAEIPADVRENLLRVNYSAAEVRCPQHIPISKFIAEAVSKLA